MYHHVLQQILGLFDQLGIQANIPSPVVAAAPFAFHALEEISGNLYAELCLPFPDQFRSHPMQQCAVSFTHDFFPLRQRASKARDEGDSTVIPRDDVLRIFLGDSLSAPPGISGSSEIAAGHDRPVTESPTQGHQVVNLELRVFSGHLGRAGHHCSADANTSKWAVLEWAGLE